MSLDVYISAAAVGTMVQKQTGDFGASAGAGGYAAFVSAITGKAPQVRNLDNARVELLLSPDQIRGMQIWLDRQTGSLMRKPADAPLVNYNLGPVFVPWAIKYLVPAGLLLFISGWLAGWYFQR